MNPSAKPESAPEAEPAPEPGGPGKIRTWWHRWHPLLVNLLRWQLGDHYRLEEEVSVGQKPLQIDILLLRKEHGDLPPEARAILAGLAERLGLLTLIEFKSPLDTLRPGDLEKFLAYAHLYRSQNSTVPPPSQMNLIVIAPQLTRSYRDEAEIIGATVFQEEQGVWRLQGGACVFPMWVLETEELADKDHPLLSAFSPQVVKLRQLIYDALIEGGYNELAAYILQQITRFEILGKDFAMQHFGTKEMHQRIADIIKDLPDDFFKDIPLEKRQRMMTIEERLKGVPAEERLQGLTAEEIARLRALLDEKSQEPNGGV